MSWDDFNESQKRIFDSLQPFIEIQQHVQEIAEKAFESIKPAIEALYAVSPQIIEIGERLKYFHEKSQEMSAELEKEDVFLIPYFSLPADMYELLEKIKSENKSILEVYDEFFCQKDNVLSLLDSWMDNPFFQERREILERCLIAHTEKDYIFTIPLFYIHVERYCKHLLGLDGNWPTWKWKKMLEDTYQSDKELEGFSKYFSESYAVEFLTKQIFEHYPEYQKLTDPLYPNRHDVLHGSNLDYYKKRHASLRCILLLDVLSDIEPKTVPESDGSAPPKVDEKQT